MSLLEGLSALSLPALSARLQRLADEASIALRQERPSAVAEALDTLRGQMDAMSGPALLMARVAESFLTRLLPGLGSPEKDAARLVVDTAAGSRLLARLVEGELVGVDALKALPQQTRAAFQILIERGAVSDTQDLLSLSSSAQGWVADLVEPLPFRLWRIVQSAKLAASWERDPERAAQIVAGMTGTFTAQARAFLSREELSGRQHEAARAPRYKRPRSEDAGHKRVQIATETLRSPPAAAPPSLGLVAEPPLANRGPEFDEIFSNRQPSDLAAE
jgi:hypothetical protein